MKPLILAHRGASGTTPENTLISFQKAIEDGADGVEFDVQLSSDGEPVVIHDETLERTTAKEGRVVDSTFKELTSYGAGAHYEERYKNEKIPSLRNVLEIVSDMEVINIELKNNYYNYKNIEEKVVKITKEMGVIDKVLFSSFNHESMVKMKELVPGSQIGVIYKAGLYQPWLYAKRLGVKNIHPYYKAINKDIIKKCQQNDIKVNVYGTNDDYEIKNLLSLGVDMIINDYPKKTVDIMKNV